MRRQVQIPLVGSLGTVPELLFEKGGLVPAIQQLLVGVNNAA